MTLKTGLATALVAAIVAALVTAATLPAILRTANEKAIVDVVRNYLTENPEILVEMTTELEERQEAKQAELQKQVISDNADAIFRAALRSRRVFASMWIR